MAQMTDSQFAIDPLKAADKKGNPVSFDPGTLQAFSDNTDVATVVASETPSPQITVTAVGALGSAGITVKAQVAGVDVAGTIQYDIISGAPTQITITPGTPQEQP